MSDSSGPSLFILTSNPLILVLLYRYGLAFIFLFGLIGNLASIITFMRPTLRVISTEFFFLILALSDVLFLFIFIFDFVEVGLTQRPIFLSHYDSLCRFRWHLKGFIQFYSTWILVFITINRWLKTRFSFKANTWCTRKNAVIIMILIIITGTCLHSYMLSAQLFGGSLPSIATSACGSANLLSGSYANFYFAQWAFIQVCFVYLIPVALMLIGSIDIYYVIRKAKGRVQPTGINQLQHLRWEHLQRQMLLLMISSIIIFFVTTLPVSLRRIMAAYETGTCTACAIEK